MAGLEIRQFNFDGTAILSDGREVQIVVTSRGVLGAQAITSQDVADRVDQAGVGNPPPTLEGLDQV